MAGSLRSPLPTRDLRGQGSACRAQYREANFCALAHSRVRARPVTRGGVVCLRQQQVAIAIALHGIEHRVFGLPFLLSPLGVDKQTLGLLALASGVQRVSMGRAVCLHPKFIAAAVRIGRRIVPPSPRRRRPRRRASSVSLRLDAPIAALASSSLPCHPQCRAHRRQRLDKRPCARKARASIAEHPGLVRRAQRGDRRLVGLIEEPGDRRKVAAKRRPVSYSNRIRSAIGLPSANAVRYRPCQAPPDVARRGSRGRSLGRAARDRTASASCLPGSCGAGDRRGGCGRLSTPLRSFASAARRTTRASADERRAHRAR